MTVAVGGRPAAAATAAKRCRGRLRAATLLQHMNRQPRATSPRPARRRRVYATVMEERALAAAERAAAEVAWEEEYHGLAASP